VVLLKMEGLAIGPLAAGPSIAVSIASTEWAWLRHFRYTNPNSWPCRRGEGFFLDFCTGQCISRAPFSVAGWGGCLAVATVAMAAALEERSPPAWGDLQRDRYAIHPHNLRSKITPLTPSSCPLWVPSPPLYPIRPTRIQLDPTGKTATRGISPLPGSTPPAAERLAWLLALRAELLAITAPTERRLYGDLGQRQNLTDLIPDLRLDAQWKALP
jgi:hypothetical protein